MSLSPPPQVNEFNWIWQKWIAEFWSNTVSVTGNEIKTLEDSATPSVKSGRAFLTGGTTTITDLLNGSPGQEIIILSEHAITITDGTNIFLSGSANFVMANTGSLHLIQKADGNWYEIGRSVN